MAIWILLALMMLALSGVLYMLTRQESSAPETERRFNEVLETPQDDSWLNQRKWRKTRTLTQRFKQLLEHTPGSDMEEIEVLLRQSALVEDKSRAMIYTSLWLTPFLSMLLCFMLASNNDWNTTRSMLFGFALGYIAPRRTLRWLAERRKRAIKEEMPIVLNLLRLLFDAGLSLEHSLKAISEQAKQITPHLANEFAWVLTRIHHGQDRGAALEEMARRIDLPELTETVAILKQAARYGGSLRESLLRYLRLMEDRRMTDLKDKVGKLSGQMSIVMMVFLFPALMIFLAGPGVLAISRAFMQIR